MYTCTGLTNLALLRSDSRIAPAMAYTNSIMAWSSTCFGPCITFVQTAPLNFAISYGHWYCVPNFGWGVEWGLQLLFEAGSGLRAVALMAASIGSYFLQNLFANRDTGFQLAFLPQVAMAIGMCAVCFRRFQSGAAARALALWVAACVCFLLLEEEAAKPSSRTLARAPRPSPFRPATAARSTSRRASSSACSARSTRAPPLRKRSTRARRVRGGGE